MISGEEDTLPMRFSGEYLVLAGMSICNFEHGEPKGFRPRDSMLIK